jgi:hypothetical protein
LPQSNLLHVTKETAALNARLTWSDSQALLAGIEAGKTAAMTQVLKLYRSPFLSGFFECPRV